MERSETVAADDRNGERRAMRLRSRRSSVGLLLGVALLGAAIVSAMGGPTTSPRAAPVPQTAAGPSRATPGPLQTKGNGPGVAHLHAGKPPTRRPQQLFLKRARSVVFDVRKLKGSVIKRERPEHEDPFGPPQGDEE